MASPMRYVKFEKEQQTVYDAQIVHMREILAQLGSMRKEELLQG